jgi:hypothetical protein
MTDQERTWCNNAMKRGGSFVSTFARVCFLADDSNFRILKPALSQLMTKYPDYGTPV